MIVTRTSLPLRVNTFFQHYILQHTYIRYLKHTCSCDLQNNRKRESRSWKNMFDTKRNVYLPFYCITFAWFACTYLSNYCASSQPSKADFLKQLSSKRTKAVEINTVTDGQKTMAKSEHGKNRLSMSHLGIRTRAIDQKSRRLPRQVRQRPLHSLQKCGYKWIEVDWEESCLWGRGDCCNDATHFSFDLSKSIARQQQAQHCCCCDCCGSLQRFFVYRKSNSLQD